MIRFYASFVIFLALTFAPTCFAQGEDPQAFTGIYVEVYVSGDLCPGNPSPGDGWAPVTGFPDRGSGCGGIPANGLAYGSNISFFADSGRTYRIYAVSSVESIGAINVSGSGYTLLVGAATNSFPPFTNAGLQLPVPGGGNIGSINASGGTVQIRAKGEILSVNAGTVIRVDARNGVGAVTSATSIGTVRAPNVSTVTAQTSITFVDVRNWDEGASASDYTSTISATTGSVTRVTSTNARMQGAVTADQGSIDEVSSNIGIGPSTGTPALLRARNGITRVSAPAINSNIDARFNGGSGQIQTLTTTAGGFSGSLQAAGIGSTGTGVSIMGPLLANVTITGTTQRPFVVSGAATSSVRLAGTVSQPVSFGGGFSSGSLIVGDLSSTTLSVTGNLGATTSLGAVPSGSSVSVSGTQSGNVTLSGAMSGTFTIGGSLTGAVTLPAGGLVGQMIINRNNAGGTWTGPVTVGGPTLTPQPAYGMSSMIYGGGAVGLAPFRLVSLQPTATTLTGSGGRTPVAA